MESLACYWPTALLCIPGCDYAQLLKLLPAARENLGVSVWPAPHQSVATDVIIDITHWQAPLGGAFAAAWALLDQLKHCAPSLSWRAGLGPGVTAARFAARNAGNGDLVDIPPWELGNVIAFVPLSEFIDSLPLRLASAFRRDGVRNCGDVLEFRTGDWLDCYGATGNEVRRCCLGLDYLEASILPGADTVQPEHGMPVSRKSLMLPVNATSFRALSAYMRVLCVRLSRELKQASQKTARIEVELWSRGAQPVWAFGVSLGMPGNQAADLYTVLQAGLRRMKQTESVSCMRMTAGQLSHEAGQMNMLDQLLAGQKIQNSTAPSINR
ncbi:MAG: hypothetical protein OEZ10_01795 [Gammaproteobacteria bacterium]|nr:hypothetical protein [Gammaproteobacteria bacterium]